MFVTDDNIYLSITIKLVFVSALLPFISSFFSNIVVSHLRLVDCSEAIAAFVSFIVFIDVLRYIVELYRLLDFEWVELVYDIEVEMSNLEINFD